MVIMKLFVLFFVLLIQQTYATKLSGDHDKIPLVENYVKKIPNGDDETARIIGGNTADEGQFPYAVALLRDRKFICTASLISVDTVLTAAHCVVENGQVNAASRFSGVFGSVDRTSDSATVVVFSSVSVHPEYDDGSLANDIAVLRMAQPITLTEKIKTICIARADTDLDEYDDATVMGWGSTRRVLVNSPKDLQYAETKLYTHNLCTLRYGSQVSEKHICADGFGSGICYGDSGGPMAYESQDKTVQLGVASFVRLFPGCGSFIISPGVHTRVSSYTPWIKSVGGSDICEL